jgi:hypothetical protein
VPWCPPWPRPTPSAPLEVSLSPLQITDFNLSKMMEESAVVSSMAATNPRWLAPEILSGHTATFASVSALQWARSLRSWLLAVCWRGVALFLGLPAGMDRGTPAYDPLLLLSVRARCFS